MRSPTSPAGGGHGPGGGGGGALFPASARATRRAIPEIDKRRIGMRVNPGAMMAGIKEVMGGGDAPERLKESAGWYTPVYVLVHLLRRESSTCGQVRWLSMKRGGGGFKKSCERWRGPLVMPP